MQGGNPRPRMSAWFPHCDYIKTPTSEGAGEDAKSFSFVGLAFPLSVCICTSEVILIRYLGRQPMAILHQSGLA